MPTKFSSNGTVQQTGRASVRFCADTIGKPPQKRRTPALPENMEAGVGGSESVLMHTQTFRYMVSR
jgi:hypothetical protein